MPNSRRSGSVTPTPRGNTTEGQLRLVFRQVMRNGAMGLDQAVFVGSHFGVDSVSMRKTFKEVANGTALDEDEFLDLMKRAMTRCRIIDEQRGHMLDGVKPSVMNKHQATLHKELSVLPFVPTNKKPLCLSPSPHKDHSGAHAISPTQKLSPMKKSGPIKKFLSQSADGEVVNRSLGGSISPPGTLSRPASRMTTPGKPRAASVPPMGSTRDVERPGSAKYLRPYTPRGIGDLSPWKWNRMDNSVPRNVRNVLLRPIRVYTRPPTPAVPDERLSHLLVRATDSLQGITRMEAIDAFTSCNEPNVQLGLISVAATRNGLQTMGFNATVEDVRVLAQEAGAMAEDDMVKFHALTSRLIPVVETLAVEDAGIQAEKFGKFKQQRLAFTKNLSTKEIKLLHILREKLNHTCQGGASELRKSFKHFDTKNTGRSTLKQMVQALALQGIGMASADADVLYSILDPDGKEGLDYNEFTALMMPPDMEDAYRETVHLGYDFRASRSRAGARDKGGGKPVKSKKPDPESVLRFLRGLTTDQVLQVLRNRVALALKAGPGAIRKLYQLFDKDGNNEIDEVELRDLLVDFGLSLSPAQVTKLMVRLDRNNNGLLDQHEFVTALLPQEHYSLQTTQADLKDTQAVGVSPENGKLSGNDLREFLREKLLRTFVKKGENSPGYQIREAISRFDTNRDGSMSSYELKKAMNALGLYVDASTIQTLIQCYDDNKTGSAEFLKFVEDIDPNAFTYAFSVGKVAMAGSFESVEKEGKISKHDSDQKIRNTLKAALRQRMKVDGMQSVLKEIRSYGMREGRMTRENFRAALLRLGLKIEHPDNLNRAFDAFCDGGDALDVYKFAAAADADFEMLPQQQPVVPDKNPRRTPGSTSRAAARTGEVVDESKATKSPTIVKVGPFKD